MKLVVAVVQGRDSETAMDALSERGYHATRVDSTGGFLRERNATLFVGVQDAYTADVVRILAQTCRAQTRFVNPLMPIAEPVDVFVPDPVQVEVGGATIFVLDVARYERIA